MGSGIEGRLLVGGQAEGRALVLDQPLSLWGGVDPATGTIIDARHPQRGAVVAGRMLVLPHGRGSSSSSSILAEAVRAGTAPAALLVREPDAILVIGALAARELYGRTCPVVLLGPDAHASIVDGEILRVALDGRISRPGRPDAPRSGGRT